MAQLNVTDLPPREEGAHVPIQWGAGIPEFPEESSLDVHAGGLGSVNNDSDSDAALDSDEDLNMPSLSDDQADAKVSSPMNVDLPQSSVPPLSSNAWLGNVSRLVNDKNCFSGELKAGEVTLEAARQKFFYNLDYICELCSVPESKKNLAALMFLDGRAKEKAMNFRSEHGRHPTMEEIHDMVDTMTRGTAVGNVELTERLFQLDLLEMALAHARLPQSPIDVQVVIQDVERQLEKRPRMDTVTEVYFWLCTLKSLPDVLEKVRTTTRHGERSEQKNPDELKRDIASLNHWFKRAQLFAQCKGDIAVHNTPVSNSIVPPSMSTTGKKRRWGLSVNPAAKHKFVQQHDPVHKKSKIGGGGNALFNLRSRVYDSSFDPFTEKRLEGRLSAVPDSRSDILWIKGATPEKKEKLRTQGLCYLCKESGHMTPHCPHAAALFKQKKHCFIKT